MAATGDEIAVRVAPLRNEVDGLRERLSALAAEAHYEDLEHAVLGLRIVDQALEEAAEHSGLGGEIRRSPDPALHACASDLAARLEQLRVDAKSLLAEQENEDLETAITALEIAHGSLHEVVERHEDGE